MKDQWQAPYARILTNRLTCSSPSKIQPAAILNKGLQSHKKLLFFAGYGKSVKTMPEYLLNNTNLIRFRWFRGPRQPTALDPCARSSAG